MPSNSKEYIKEYMRKHADEKVECEHCHKEYSKYSKYKHIKTKYHKNYGLPREEDLIKLTKEDIIKLKALINKEI